MRSHDHLEQATHASSRAHVVSTKDTIMIDLKLEMAETAVRTAQAKARALGTPMTVTVVDEAGRLVLSARGDGTGFLTPETSRAKATAAAAFKKSTAELTAQGAKGWGFWQVMPIVAQGEVLPTLGGAPIVVGGRVIGGIGCGGGTGEQDQECADAGAAAVKG
jgi:glc operon protein GlcG